MSTVVEAAPVAVKRKKANKISQPTPPSAASSVGPPDEPAGLGVERSSSSLGAAGTWQAAADPHDEVPIGKKGPSTFEELLERELARDQASHPPQAQSSKSASKVTFLKRGSGAGAALVKTKTDSDRRTSLGEGGGDDSSRVRQPLAETSRNQQNTPAVESRRSGSGIPGSSRFKDSSSRPSTAPQTQLAANAWDDIPVGGGGMAQQEPKREAVRSVARKLDVEHVDAVLGMHKPQTAMQKPAARNLPEPESASHDSRPNRNRLRQLQQLDPEEEAELMEFESLERKIVQAGADDSMYRGVLNQDPYANGYDDESDGTGELVDHEDDEALEDTASMNHYIYDESETWDNADRDSAVAALQDEVDEQISEQGGSLDNQYGGAEAPARSSLVNKLFIQKQTKGRQAQQQRKSAEGRAKQTGPCKQSAAASFQETTSNQPEDAKDSDVDTKMAELEKEIREFRKQNELLDKLRREVDAERQQVEHEKANLAENLQEAEQRFERYKEAELKKMKRDRKDIDKQLQLAQAQVADLRGERDSMRQEMQVLQEDGARREKKLKSEIERLKKKVEDVQMRNEDLVRELKFSEEARVAIQDKEHLASLKAKLSGKQDLRAGQPPVQLCLSPRSQDALATQIATNVVEAQLESDAHIGSLSASSQRDCYDETSTGKSGNLLSRALDTSENDSRHHDSKHQDDSMMTSFQVDRTGMITDETLEIDVAKMRKFPVNSMAREKNQPKVGGGGDASITVVSEKQHGDGKIERLFADGKKLLIFSNGTRKEVFPGGGSVVHFSNKDVKHTFPDGKVVYYYSETRTSHTTQPDGMEMFEFSNGQREKHLPDGRKEILFPDGTLKNIHINKEEESIFPDGTVQRIYTDGTRVIEFPNGLKETVSPNGNKVRTFE